MAWSNQNELSNAPAMPKYSISRIRAQQGRIRDWLVEGMQAFGSVFQGACREGLRRIIIQNMPHHVPEESSVENRLRIENAVDSFLQPLLGRLIDDTFTEEVSLKLVEWMPRLEAAEEYRSWDQVGKIWALVYALDIERQLSKEGRNYVCRFQAIAGSAAGMYWDTFMNGGQMQHLLRCIGLPKYAKYSDLELGGLYMIAYLRPDAQRINIGEASGTSSVLTHNRKLYRERQGSCIGGFWIGKCMNCPLGRKECRLSRHQHPYTEQSHCENYHFANGKRTYHKGYKIKRDQGVCLECLNTGHIRAEMLQVYYRNKKKNKGKS